MHHWLVIPEDRPAYLFITKKYVLINLLVPYACRKSNLRKLFLQKMVFKVLAKSVSINFYSSQNWTELPTTIQEGLNTWKCVLSTIQCAKKVSGKTYSH